MSIFRIIIAHTRPISRNFTRAVIDYRHSGSDFFATGDSLKARIDVSASNSAGKGTLDKALLLEVVSEITAIITAAGTIAMQPRSVGFHMTFGAQIGFGRCFHIVVNPAGGRAIKLKKSRAGLTGSGRAILSPQMQYALQFDLIGDFHGTCA